MLGFFLCLLFVIYLEAEIFKMGKSVLYILKVINMPVPWLPAGLQNTWMKMRDAAQNHFFD